MSALICEGSAWHLRCSTFFCSLLVHHTSKQVCRFGFCEVAPLDQVQLGRAWRHHHIRGRLDRRLHRTRRQGGCQCLSVTLFLSDTGYQSISSAALHDDQVSRTANRAYVQYNGVGWKHRGRLEEVMRLDRRMLAELGSHGPFSHDDLAVRRRVNKLWSKYARKIIV